MKENRIEYEIYHSKKTGCYDENLNKVSDFTLFPGLIQCYFDREDDEVNFWTVDDHNIVVKLLNRMAFETKLDCVKWYVRNKKKIGKGFRQFYRLIINYYFDVNKDILLNY
jgi:hypothetical protein